MDNDNTSGGEDFIEKHNCQNNITQIISQMKSAVFKKASTSYPNKI